MCFDEKNIFVLKASIGEVFSCKICISNFFGTHCMQTDTHIFPQSLHLIFFLYVFLYVDLQIAFGPKIVPTKFALKLFSPCVFGMWTFTLPLVRKLFPQSLHLNYFPHVFLVCGPSHCLWSEKCSHKVCT